jgi:hypothetical protein
MFKRAVGLAGVAAFACGLCFGQDLAEAAKKEKERRAAQKNVKSVVLTNAMLTDLKKKPAVPSIRLEGGPIPGPAGSFAPPVPLPGTTTAVPTTGPEPGSPGAAGPGQEPSEPQARYDRAKERMDLLGLKLLSLRQQLTTFDSMQTKDKVQKEFAETYQTFLQAQADAAKAKEDLDRALGEGGSTATASAIK